MIRKLLALLAALMLAALMMLPASVAFAACSRTDAAAGSISEAGIVKKADKTSVSKGDKVRYTLKVKVPYYETNAANKSFSIADSLNMGLTLDRASIRVKLSSGETVGSSKYDLSTQRSGFVISSRQSSYDNYWKKVALDGKKLIITYKAKLDNDKTSDPVIKGFNTKARNNATLTYSETTNGITDLRTKTASVGVNSYTIKVVKHDLKDETKLLKGAKFELYRTVSDSENMGQIPHAKVRGKLLESGMTDENGVLEFKKYEANGITYNYYLVETLAPDGYNLPSKAYKVNFTDSTLAATNGVYTVKIDGTKGYTLPMSTGMLILIIIAITAIIGSALHLAHIRKS